MSNPLSFTALTALLASVLDAQYDPRQPGKTRYALSDAGLAAFAVFFTQSPSFLAYQRDMEKRQGTSNAHTLFGMKQLPTDTHIRTLLDPIDPEALSVLFRHAYGKLAEQGVVERFKVAGGKVLLALDGTDVLRLAEASLRQLQHARDVQRPAALQPPPGAGGAGLPRAA